MQASVEELKFDAAVAQSLQDMYDLSDGKSSMSDWTTIADSGDDGVYWGSRPVLLPSGAPATLIALRGSKSLLDWLRDLDAFCNPFVNKGLGPVHAGFKIGLDDVLQDALRLPGPYVVAGHSLGAARTALLAGLMVLKGVKPARIVCFGQPRPGFKQLADVLFDIPQGNYCNGAMAHDHDKVTDVPWKVGPNLYEHSGPLTYVDQAPALPERMLLGMFARHHMPLYVAAMSKLVASVETSQLNLPLTHPPQASVS
jgi:hypothetical protein